MDKHIDRIGNWIIEKYIVRCKKRGKLPFSKQQEKELVFLYPGSRGSELIKKYYQGKINKTIKLFCALAILTIAVSVNQLNNHVISDDNTLVRNDVGHGDNILSLNASEVGYDYGVVDVSVHERELSDSEYIQLVKELKAKLQRLILKENPDLEHVSTNLDLRKEIEGYPFLLRWESGDYSLIRDNGELGDKEPEKTGTKTWIRAEISYRDKIDTVSYSVIVYPPVLSEDELKHNAMLEEIEISNEATSITPYMYLPKKVNGKDIVWKEARDGTVILLLTMSVVVILAVWKGEDKDLKKRLTSRSQSLLVEYSDFVSKLQLLLSSGLTIRGALERMEAEYSKKNKEGGEKQYVYEELSLCIKKLKSGVSERECYEYFGSRCNLMVYKKLSSLLVQNLKKGTDGLIAALENETKNAFEERKAMARRKGEEAQTKLIFPMMLMLGVVMIIIMIPAYMSFGGM